MCTQQMRIEELELGRQGVGRGGNVELLEDHRLVGHDDPQHLAQPIKEETLFLLVCVCGRAVRGEQRSCHANQRGGAGYPGRAAACRAPGNPTPAASAQTCRTWTWKECELSGRE